MQAMDMHALWTRDSGSFVCIKKVGSISKLSGCKIGSNQMVWSHKHMQPQDSASDVALCQKKGKPTTLKMLDILVSRVFWVLGNGPFDTSALQSGTYDTSVGVISDSILK